MKKSIELTDEQYDGIAKVAERLHISVTELVLKGVKACTLVLDLFPSERSAIPDKSAAKNPPDRIENDLVIDEIEEVNDPLPEKPTVKPMIAVLKRNEDIKEEWRELHKEFLNLRREKKESDPKRKREIQDRMLVIVAREKELKKSMEA